MYSKQLSSPKAEIEVGMHAKRVGQRKARGFVQRLYLER